MTRRYSFFCLVTTNDTSASSPCVTDMINTRRRKGRVHTKVQSAMCFAKFSNSPARVSAFAATFSENPPPGHGYEQFIILMDSVSCHDHQIAYLNICLRMYDALCRHKFRLTRQHSTLCCLMPTTTLFCPLPDARVRYWHRIFTCT